MREVVHRFIEEVLIAMPQFRRRCKVLDIGSYDINGSCRSHFQDCEYVGVDWRAGPGVDVVAMARDLTFLDVSFDVVLSTESLEHDLYWDDTIHEMKRLLCVDGLFLLTVASFDFPKHHPECSTVAGYYHNIMPDELQPLLADLRQVSYQEKNDGIFYAGIK